MLGVASCILLLTQQRPVVWLFGAILIAVGGVLYVLARWGRKHAEKRNTHPDGDPVDNQKESHEHA